MPGKHDRFRELYSDDDRAAITAELDAAGISRAADGSFTLPERDDLDLLRSYADGPRIWDAADIYDQVLGLAGQGLIERVPDRPGAYQLTTAGRQLLSCADLEH